MIAAAADGHLRAGDVDAARAELAAMVRANPGDQRARMYLFQLLCVSGEWDKADSQLRGLAQLSAEARMLATVYGQAIAAERARAAAFAGSGAFVFHDGADLPWAEDFIAALTLDAAGRHAEAAARREHAFSIAPDTPGEADGVPFGWIADADQRFALTLELVLNGRWGLLPFELIESLAFEPVQDLRDLVWRPVQLRLRSGLSAAVLACVRYPGSEGEDGATRLARATRWETVSGGGERGLGQRLLTTDTGDDLGLLDLGTVAFGAADGGADG